MFEFIRFLFFGEPPSEEPQPKTETDLRSLNVDEIQALHTAFLEKHDYPTLPLRIEDTSASFELNGVLFNVVFPENTSIVEDHPYGFEIGGKLFVPNDEEADYFILDEIRTLMEDFVNSCSHVETHLNKKFDFQYEPVSRRCKDEIWREIFSEKVQVIDERQDPFLGTVATEVLNLAAFTAAESRLNEAKLNKIADHLGISLD